MTSPASATLCPKCGEPVAADAPQGLCPRCVLAGAAAPTDAGLKPGERLSVPPMETVAAAFPQLEILELLGLGGMGVVYKARQPRLDRLVALKLLPQSLSADPAFAERFHREARFLARLNHPNIVTVFDFGFAPIVPPTMEAATQQPGPGFCYLLLEFVDGVNLRQAMQAGRFSPAEALTIIPSICGALQYAHEQGVLHRDIKPENILLDARGRVKLADFGIAKLVRDPGDQRADVTLTQSGSRLGTPHYMAPEQIESPSQVDHRADIYSLGVVFYELLTGELPLGRFAAPSEKVDLDARIDAIVFRALAKDRELRQQSAGAVKTEVEGLGTDAGGQPPRTRPITSRQVPAAESVTAPPAELPDWAKRFGWLMLFYAVLGIPGSILIRYHPTPDVSVFRWPTEILLLPVAVALWNRRLEWRFFGLISSALLLAWQSASLLAFAIWLASGPQGLQAFHPNSEVDWIVGLLQIGVPLASLWTLTRPAVVAAFENLAPIPSGLAVNPWPHRLFWLVIALIFLPAAAFVAGILAPVIKRMGFELGAGFLAGMVPMITGILIGLGYFRTRPQASEATVIATWSPWPHRLFWLLVAVVLMPASLVLTGLLVPQLVRTVGAPVGVMSGLLPIVLLGWLIWGFVKTLPGATETAAFSGGKSIPQRILLGVLLGIAVPLFLVGLCLFLSWQQPILLVPQTVHENPPTLIVPVAGTAMLTRTERTIIDSQVRLSWDLRASKPARVRLSSGSAAKTALLTRVGPNEYHSKISVIYELRPNGNEMFVTVQTGDARDGGILQFNLPEGGQALYSKAGELVAGNLVLNFNTPVWIAFIGLEQIRLEVLPGADPKPEIGDLPQTLPGGLASAAALKWHLAWQGLQENRKKVEVGMVAPGGAEMLAAERDLVVAESEFLGEPALAAQARLAHAEQWFAIVRKMMEVGRATSLEVNQAELQMVQAKEGLSGLVPVANPGTSYREDLASVFRAAGRRNLDYALAVLESPLRRALKIPDERMVFRQGDSAYEFNRALSRRLTALKALLAARAGDAVRLREAQKAGASLWPADGELELYEIWVDHFDPVRADQDTDDVRVNVSELRALQAGRDPELTVIHRFKAFGKPTTTNRITGDWMIPR